MPNFVYEIPTIWLAIYCSLFFVGLTWFGIIFIKPVLRLMMGREPHINDLVAQATAGFSLFYGLLLGLLAVAAYQNFDEVRRSVFAEAATLGSLYRTPRTIPTRCGAKSRRCCGTTPSTSSTRTGPLTAAA